MKNFKLALKENSNSKYFRDFITIRVAKHMAQFHWIKQKRPPGETCPGIAYAIQVLQLRHITNALIQETLMKTVYSYAVALIGSC